MNRFYVVLAVVAIVLGVVVFAVVPFVLSRVLALYYIRRLERAALAVAVMRDELRRS